MTISSAEQGPGLVASQTAAFIQEVDEYRWTVERAERLYVVLATTGLMGNGPMERACVEIFDLPDDAIAAAYQSVTEAHRVRPAPPGGRWWPGAAAYPLSPGERMMRLTVMDIARAVLPPSLNPLNQFTSDVGDW